MRLVLVAFLWTFATFATFASVVGSCVSTSPVSAQVVPASQPPADMWLAHVLKEQRRTDRGLRWVAAPLSLVLGGASAVLPAVLDTSTPSTIAYLGSGMFMLTAALSTWANEDPYDARRAYSFWGSLGFTAFGAGLALSCLNEDDVCGKPGIGRRLQVGVGLIEAGFFVSNAMLSLFMPPPSATRLELSVKHLSASERHGRVLEFLERRDRQRRVAAYIGGFWGVALGSYFLANASGAATTEGKALLYGGGAALVAFTIAAFLYEQLRRGDAVRLRAGELSRSPARRSLLAKRLSECATRYGRTRARRIRQLRPKCIQEGCPTPSKCESI